MASFASDVASHLLRSLQRPASASWLQAARFLRARGRGKREARRREKRRHYCSSVRYAQSPRDSVVVPIVSPPCRTRPYPAHPPTKTIVGVSVAYFLLFRSGFFKIDETT
jgi:hypothetical protein